MLTCPACVRPIHIAGARWCPHCGASLSDAETRPAPELPSPAPPLEDARFPPGFLFASRYRIVSLLGRGAMGEVYRADDLRLGQAIALKLLAAHRERAEEAFARFTSEVRLARRIAHPSVCRVYDMGEADGWHFLSMEYVDGETLASLLRRIGRPRPDKALDFTRQLVAGLAAAHEGGVLHRDLKPSNIMVDGRGRIRILDFGLAVSVADGTLREIAGTPAYMAPEQLTGGPITERTDLYALGLVAFEIFSGRRYFAANSIAERLAVGRAATPRDIEPMADPRVAAIVAACLRDDPAARPATALAVAAELPGGDPLTAAIAEGHVPSVGMVAAAPNRGALSVRQAWAILLAVVTGLVACAYRAEILTLAPSALPKPPQVLADRAMALAEAIGPGATRVDQETWWSATATRGDDRVSARFVYRQSPQPLVAHNAFHIVTEDDPPADVPGMTSITLDASARLVRFSRVPDPVRQPGAGETDWSTHFRAAGLDPGAFVGFEPDRMPLVPHDRRWAWAGRSGPGGPVRVDAAALDGRPVYFNVADERARQLPFHGVLAAGPPPAAASLFSALVAAAFLAMGVMARRNLRAGDGDRGGAAKLFGFVAVGGTLTELLRAHHVALGQEEVVLIVAVSGWALVWAAFSWLAYVSFEPYVRRLWPGTLISWTRLLAGRLLDPLVGRDVLIGALCGVVNTGILIAQLHVAGSGPPDQFLGPALETLRSARHYLAIVVWGVLDALQFALGGLFFIVMIRLLLRRTWIAIVVLIIAFAPLFPAGTSGPAGFAGAALVTVIGVTVLLRAGLLAFAVMQVAEHLLRHTPITLDSTSWYFGSAVTTLLLVTAIATYGFVVSLGGQAALGGPPRAGSPRPVR